MPDLIIFGNQKIDFLKIDLSVIFYKLLCEQIPSQINLRLLCQICQVNFQLVLKGYNFGPAGPGLRGKYFPPSEKHYAPMVFF